MIVSPQGQKAPDSLFGPGFESPRFHHCGSELVSTGDHARTAASDPRNHTLDNQDGNKQPSLHLVQWQQRPKANAPSLVH